MQDAMLIPGTEALAAESPTRTTAQSSNSDPPRLRRPDRRQMLLEPTCVDERLPADHPARTIWRVVEQLDLSAFYQPIAARGQFNSGAMGRPAAGGFARVLQVSTGRSATCPWHPALP